MGDESCVFLPSGLGLCGVFRIKGSGGGLYRGAADRGRGADGLELFQAEKTGVLSGWGYSLFSGMQYLAGTVSLPDIIYYINVISCVENGLDPFGPDHFLCLKALIKLKSGINYAIIYFRCFLGNVQKLLLFKCCLSWQIKGCRVADDGWCSTGSV